MEPDLACADFAQASYRKTVHYGGGKGNGVAPRYRVLNKLMLRVAGWFNGEIGESYEMLYQSDSPYIFDSSKFANAFGFSGTPYAEGIRATAASFKKSRPPSQS